MHIYIYILYTYMCVCVDHAGGGGLTMDTDKRDRCATRPPECHTMYIENNKKKNLPASTLAQASLKHKLWSDPPPSRDIRVVQQEAPGHSISQANTTSQSQKVLRE